MSLSYWDHNYVQWIYQYLKGQIGNDYGVSGLLGNIYAESGICPFACQGDSSPFTTSYDITMNLLRSMSSYDFQHYHMPGVDPSWVGYSLAQWTTYSRKDDYYNFCTQALLGDGTKSAEFLVQELQTPSYIGVWNVLTSATSVRQASNKVLFDFESPADQSLPVQNLRAYYGQEVYNEFSGLPPAPATRLPIWMLSKFNDR